MSYIVCINFLVLIAHQYFVEAKDDVIADNNHHHSDLSEWDPQGYILFCLCMGRFGNQMEHFLGGLHFAKKLNRTLLLPPFHTYKNVKFTDYIKMEPIGSYHKVMVAEDFMAHFAENYWPKGQRHAMCWLPAHMADQGCNMKNGSPFGPFWDGLGVDFDDSIVHQLSYNQAEEWKRKFPPEKYPVIALKGAPASFPMSRDHWHLQKYIELSDDVQAEAEDFIQASFPNQKYIAIHLRNGVDWKRACEDVQPTKSYMAGVQCTHGNKNMITKENCFPSKEEVLQKLKTAVEATDARVIFVSTDKDPMIDAITNHLAAYKVSVYHADPWLPLVDWAILIKADLFIGNCVSSFSSFVRRSRDMLNKETEYFAFNF